MSNHEPHRLAPRLRDLSPSQRMLMVKVDQSLHQNFGRRTCISYGRLVRIFVHGARICAVDFDTLANVTIKRRDWDRLVDWLGITIADKDRLDATCNQIRQAVLAVFEKADLPERVSVFTRGPSKKQRDVTTLPMSAFSETDKLFLGKLESAKRQHHADDIRRFHGLVARVDRSILNLPLENRFSQEILGPILDQVLEPLVEYNQFNRLHLIGRHLNEHFGCSNFAWLYNEILMRANAIRPKRMPKPQSMTPTQNLVQIQDFQKDPLKSILDELLPTVARPFARNKLVSQASRRTYETDIRHLLNARIVNGIGLPTDPPSDWFSVASIDAVTLYLDGRMAPRTKANTLVRLRGVNYRLHHDQDNQERRRMRFLSRHLFKNNPSSPKLVDDIDDIYLDQVLKGEIERILSQLDNSRGTASCYEYLEFRDILIMFLALTYGLRNRNLAMLQRRHIVVTGDIVTLEIPKNEVKNKMELRFQLPEWFLPVFNRYLLLLPSCKKPNDFLWLTKSGFPVSECEILRLVAGWSTSILGTRLTPHDLRRLTSKRKQIENGGSIKEAQMTLAHRKSETTFGKYKTRIRPNHQKYLSALLQQGRHSQPIIVPP